MNTSLQGALRQDLRPQLEIIGKSKSIIKIREFADKAAHGEQIIFIRGETGVGKDLLAEYIHELGRPNARFVPIDCGAMPETLCESELFGHVAGAYTDARHARDGLVKVAEHGTLFLNEVANMPRSLQVKFLRVLDTKTYRPVGSTTEVPMKTRIIAATNANMEQAVKKGEVRHDLYERLNSITCFIPPLRDRKEDIPVLANHFLHRAGNNHHFSDETMSEMMAYDWPGNVRELAKTLQRALMACQSQYLAPKHIDLSLTGGKTQQPEAAGDTTKDDAESFHPVTVGNYKKMVREYRKTLLRSALELADGNQSEAARLLGLNRTHLIRLLGRHDLTKSGEME